MNSPFFMGSHPLPASFLHGPRSFCHSALDAESRIELKTLDPRVKPEDDKLYIFLLGPFSDFKC